jgi:hypothetical protein
MGRETAEMGHLRIRDPAPIRSELGGEIRPPVEPRRGGATGV